jgi:hypothetical protein
MTLGCENKIYSDQPKMNHHIEDIDTCTYRISILTLSPIVSNLTYKHLIAKPLTKLL